MILINLYLFLWQQVLKFSFVFLLYFTFPMNWVGRAMRNDTLYWDGFKRRKIYKTESEIVCASI